MIVNEQIAAYITSLESEMPEYLTKLEQKALSEHVPIIRKDAQSLLKFFLTMKQPKAILEVGTAVGFSGSLMSEYMPEGATFTTIEKVEMRIKEAKVNLAAARRSEDITLLCGEAMDVLTWLNGDTTKQIEIFYPAGEEKKKELPKQFDFIFMDAAKAQYMNFLPQVMKLLKSGGLFLTDNVLQDGSIARSKYSITRRDRTIHMRMREYLYEITHMEELTTVILPIGDGMAVSVKK